jgi:ankyrin repeat protein
MFRRCLRLALHLLLFAWFAAAHAGSYEDFFSALENDNVRVVRSLLERGFDPNTRDPQGQVGLYVALRAESFDAVQALWAHPQLDVNAVNEAGETPLMMAALRGSEEWTKKLLARGAEVHKPGWSPVHYAATGPETAPLQVLLDAGAPVDARSPNGSTPLMMAARYGKETSVDLLLARGADVRARNDAGATAAEFARMDGRVRLAARLEGLAR